MPSLLALRCKSSGGCKSNGAARSRAGRQADLFVLVLEDEAVRVEVDPPIDVSVVVDALAGRRLHAVAFFRRDAVVGAPAEDKALAVRDAVDSLSAVRLNGHQCSQYSVLPPARRAEVLAKAKAAEAKAKAAEKAA